MAIKNFFSNSKKKTTKTTKTTTKKATTTKKKTTTTKKTPSKQTFKSTSDVKKAVRTQGKGGNGSNNKKYDTGNYYKNRANNNQYFANQEKKKGITGTQKVKGKDGNMYNNKMTQLKNKYNTDVSSNYKRMSKIYDNAKKQEEYDNMMKEFDKTDVVGGIGKFFSGAGKTIGAFIPDNNDKKWHEEFNEGMSDMGLGFKQAVSNPISKSKVASGVAKGKEVLDEAFDLPSKFFNSAFTNPASEWDELKGNNNGKLGIDDYLGGLIGWKDREYVEQLAKDANSKSLKEDFIDEFRSNSDTISKVTEDYIANNPELSEDEQSKLRARAILQGGITDIASDILASDSIIDLDLTDLVKGTGKATKLGAKGDDLAKINKLGKVVDDVDISDSVRNAIGKVKKGDAYDLAPTTKEIERLANKIKHTANKSRKVNGNDSILAKVGDKTIAPLYNRGKYEVGKMLNTKGYRNLGKSLDELADNELAKMISKGRITNKVSDTVNDVAKAISEQDFNYAELDVLEAILKGNIDIDDVRLAKNAEKMNIDLKKIRKTVDDVVDSNIPDNAVDDINVSDNVDNAVNNINPFSSDVKNVTDDVDAVRKDIDAQKEWDDMFEGIGEEVGTVHEYPNVDDTEIKLANEVSYYKHMYENAMPEYKENFGFDWSKKDEYKAKWQQAQNDLDDYKASKVDDDIVNAVDNVSSPDVQDVIDNTSPSSDVETVQDKDEWKLNSNKPSKGVVKKTETDAYVENMDGTVIDKETGEVFPSMKDYKDPELYHEYLEYVSNHSNNADVDMKHYNELKKATDPRDIADISDARLRDRVKSALESNDVNNIDIDSTVDELDEYIGRINKKLSTDTEFVRQETLDVIEKFTTELEDLIKREVDVEVLGSSASKQIKEDLFKALIEQDDVAENVKRLKKRFITDDFGFGQKSHRYKGYISKETYDDAVQDIFANPEEVGKKLGDMLLERYAKGEKAIYDKKATNHMIELLGYKDKAKAPKGYRQYINIATVKDNVHKLAKDQVIAKFGDVLSTLSRNEINEVFNEAYRDVCKNVYGIDYDMDLNELATPLLDLSDKRYKPLVNSLGYESRYLDPSIVTKFNLARKLQITREQHKLLQIWDTFTSAFKASVTAYNPAWHIQNFKDNYLQSYIETGIEAFSLKRHSQSTRIVNEIMGDRKVVFDTVKLPTRKLKDGKLDELYGNTKYTYQDIIDELEDSGLVEASAMASELGHKAYGNVRKIVNSPDLSLGDKTKAIISEYMLPQSEKSVWSLGGLHNADRGELIAKTNIVLAEIDKGNDLLTAIEKANHALFDYSDLSEFEHQVMKRLIPFYTWARKNISYQLEAKFAHPMRLKILNDAKELANSYGEAKAGAEDEERNQWTEDMIRLPYNKQEETNHRVNEEHGYASSTLKDYGRYMKFSMPFDEFSKFSTFGVWDYDTNQKDENGNKIWDEFGDNIVEGEEIYLNKVNPLLKLAYELGTNENIFDNPIVGEESEYNKFGDKPHQQRLNYILDQYAPYWKEYQAVQDYKEDDDVWKLLGELSGYKNKWYNINTQFPEYGRIMDKNDWYNLPEDAKKKAIEEYLKKVNSK